MDAARALLRARIITRSVLAPEEDEATEAYPGSRPSRAPLKRAGGLFPAVATGQSARLCQGAHDQVLIGTRLIPPGRCAAGWR